MTSDEIKSKLTDVFHDVFDSPELVLSETMTAADVAGWDSLTHINLVVACEKAFGVTFTTKEVRSLGNVGDLLQLISRRLAS